MNGVTSLRTLPAFVVLLIGAGSLAGCVTATTAGSGVPLPNPHPAADGPVSGQGTVLQRGTEPPQLCLGAIAESYPPQCAGPEILGWDWDAVEIKESAGDVTWGAYAVFGLWDGERFELTEPAIPLALYDPMPHEPDPRLDPATPGAGDDAQLEGIHSQLVEASAFDQLSSWSENGYLWMSVIYDDGSLQEYVDERFGPDLVAIRSALTRAG